ncbi:MAG TPA: polyphosphate kinase 1, partial [Fimbriimonadaceae bacterium]|nr:polyphosphate kinase 1 [Fimbriimonadaceae bacterium]
SFVASAATDPNVIGIKQTLYRVGEKSPIVESLLDAANAGKQVAVMVELKARFDEGNNLVWARALERAGVHVTFGFPELKTHCKLCMVVRREPFGIRSYAHIGTGNYNPETARLYTDLGLFTSDPEITQDILELFNFLTGFSRQTVYRKLLVAPLNLREGILDRIEEEVRLHKKSGKGRIIFKLNSLVDPEIIDALYAASRAGVSIDLIVRGICCLRPGVAGMSENIRVISVVGRFLEHSRAFYFNRGGEPEALIGSADLMRRNLDRRIEVLVPVDSPQLVKHIRDDILEPYLRDNVKAWHMKPDGEYVRCRPAKVEPAFSAQLHFLDHPSGHQRFEGA